MPGPSHYVVIAGNGGVGKSTLTRLIADSMGWSSIFESTDDNPYLPDFYRDMPRWCFQSQLFFVSRRLRDYSIVRDRDRSIVQDRSIYEDAEILARNLYQLGHMVERDWQLYFDLYQELLKLAPAPDLVVYLKASVPTLMTRIRRRGRGYESAMEAEYLSQLNQLYDEWADRFTLCPLVSVNTDDIDFAENEEDFDRVRGQIMNALSNNSVGPDD